MMSVTSEEEAGEDDKFLSDEDGALDGRSDNSSAEDDDDDDDDDEDLNGDDNSDDDDGRSPSAARLPRTMSQQQQHNFAPPFYGRPPTPLPPSPSLTSLLRPSRPTTPDASDDELEPVPRASPKVPTYEYYGFVLYLFSSLTFLLYLLWSFLPAPFLHALGISYYPDRWWSLAIPSFLVVLLVYTYVALAAYNTEILTLPLASVETVVDEAAKVAVVDSKGRIKERESARRRRFGGGGSGSGGGGRDGGRARDKERDRERGSKDWRTQQAGLGLLSGGGGGNWKEIWSHGTDAVMDIPLAGVCEVLYGEGRERTEQDRDDEDVIS